MISNTQPFAPGRFSSALAFNVALLNAPLTPTAQRALAGLCTDIDDPHFAGREIYWLCQCRQSESALSNKVFENALGDQMTVRSASTLRKLVAKHPASTVGSSGFSHAQVVVGTTGWEHRVQADRPVAVYAGHARSATALSFPVDLRPPANLAPTCDAGGPHQLSCAGPTTVVPLSALGSTDPESKPLTFLWSSLSPALGFSDPAIATPMATVAGLGTITVDLEVGDGVNFSSCSTTIELSGDTTVPPELDRLGVPLLMARRGAEVLARWQDLGGLPITYSLYEGPIKFFYTEAPLACGLAGTSVVPGTREETFTPSAGSVYYFMSAVNCAAEGPTGGDQALAVCPP